MPVRPPASEAERAALGEAGRWLDAATLAHARDFALGEERSFDVDQDTGRLTLHYGDGWRVDLQIQILGSFRPQDRSLRWAWANSGVDPAMAAAACVARDSEATRDFASFHTPTFEAPFEDCVRLVAMAARLAGCDGVYRCITDHSLSVFAGYRSPVPTGTAPASPTSEETEAIALVDAYDREMLPIDQRFARENRDLQPAESVSLMDRLLDEKRAIHRRFWRADDDQWDPCSFGAPSEHDPAGTWRRFSMPRRAGGVYVVSQRSDVSVSAAVVQRLEDGPRLTEIDLDWGAGVMLPGVWKP